MDSDFEKRFLDLEMKLDAIYASTEKTRKYFQWTLIATALLFILPLIAMLFILPSAISNITGGYSIEN
ncbi:MAG: hypothetical protein HGA67_02085 [Candidatus Yonathbacteria bacterium]|nr:hypothetical protein [Candidatus Yonathbacteria bacterium]